MSLLKNLMILAVLAAVGYGIYLSLSPNNTDLRSSPDETTGDLSNAKLSLTPGGPLAVDANSAGNSGTSRLIPRRCRHRRWPAVRRQSHPQTRRTRRWRRILRAARRRVAPLTPPPLPANGLTAALGPPLLSGAAPNAAPATRVESASAFPASPPDNQLPAASGVRNFGPPPEAAAAAGGISPADKGTDDLLQRQFTDVMEGVRKKLDEKKLAEAQLALSILYVNPKLPADQAKQITDLLDQLAGTIIYSRQSYLQPPYVVQPGDTIDRIAQKYKVPWQLLARINGLISPGAPNSDETVKDQPLPAGRELKIIEGPFDAIISLDKRQLTLMVQNRYAGRFPIGIGRDQPKLDGQYTVGDKKLNPTYYSPDGITIGPNDPQNPLGGAWIGLTDRIGIHGTPDPQNLGRDDNRGSICVNGRDLQDLYGILSVGSRVTILR